MMIGIVGENTDVWNWHSFLNIFKHSMKYVQCCMHIENHGIMFIAIVFIYWRYRNSSCNLFKFCIFIFKSTWSEITYCFFSGGIIALTTGLSLHRIVVTAMEKIYFSIFWIQDYGFNLKLIVTIKLKKRFMYWRVRTIIVLPKFSFLFCTLL